MVPAAHLSRRYVTATKAEFFAGCLEETLIGRHDDAATYFEAL